MLPSDRRLIVESAAVAASDAPSSGEALLNQGMNTPGMGISSNFK
ncbi:MULTISPECIES: hypothetical protein [unclassified Microcoleus]